MDKKLLAINGILVMIIVGILALTLKIWLRPAYLSSAGKPSTTAAAQKFEDPTTLRKAYPPATAEAVSQKNLFRKERAEYVPPPAPAAPAGPAIPPPSLKVNGVLLSLVNKIAVLEGTYSVLNGPAIESKPVKKKGYNLGEQIGNYHIVDIARESVTLDNKEGTVVKVNIAQRPPENRIQRQGNHFFHRLKGGGLPVVPVIISGALTNTVVPNGPPAGFISGAMTPPQAISGAMTSPQPAPPAIISGAMSVVPQGGISGAATPPPAGARISGG